MKCMDKYIVQTGVPYPIYFRHSYEGLGRIFNENFEGRKAFIVTDSNVAPLYLETVKKALPSHDPPSYIFEAGEGSKHMGVISEMYKCFLANKLDRRSVIVALGGGVCGDMAGFAAATYMRGLDYIQLPTSLLAQVDSSVGGKTAVDFEGIKNLIGAFHQPRLVYINLATLDTLPRREFISGLGEVVKHGFISDSGDPYRNYLENNQGQILALDPAALLEVVAGSCRIKASVVAQDEKEKGLREILNFGHCVGHAVESLSDYTLPHGHCVAIGMCAAFYMSQKMGNITKSAVKSAVELIKAYGLPTTASEYTPKSILSFMYKDKKTINDTLRIVLLKEMGIAYTDDKLSKEYIMECLNEIN